MVYDTHYTCVYNSPDVFLETDQVSESEREFILDVLYRQDILNIFNMEDYNIDELTTAINELYEKIKINDKLIKIMIKLAGDISSMDEKLGLMIMFSFDYLYITHPCICEFLETGQITNKLLDELLIK
jgi:hypothetical protein